MTELLERETEVSLIGAALDRARDGAGAVAVIQAPAGAGKSTLLVHALEHRVPPGALVLRARAGELERELPFGVMRQLLAGPLAAADGAVPGRALLDAVLRPVPGAGGPHPDSPFAAMHAIHGLLQALAADRPLVLAVDDAHWADLESLRTLGYLARRVDELPVAVVVALRPDAPGVPPELVPELTAGVHAADVRPRPLSAAAVRTLVRARMPDADEDACAACHTATGGNPFYLGELLRALPDRFDRAAVDAASIPALGERVLHRVAAIGPGAVGLVQAMAVLGDGARLDDAAALAGMDEARAADRGRGLARIDVLAGVDPVRFAHPLVLRSVLDELTVVERDALHRRAAERLRDRGAGVEAVAAHLRRLRPAGDPDVATTLAAAAQEALGRGATSAAREALERALAESAPAPPRWTLHQALGQAAALDRDPAAAVHLLAAREEAPDPRTRAMVSLGLINLLAAAGRWVDALALSDQVMADLAPDDADLLAETDLLRAVMFGHDARRAARFDAERPRYLRLAAGGTWPGRAMAATLASVAAQRGEHLDEVPGLVRHAMEGGVLFAERGGGGYAAVQLIGALALLDEITPAQQAIEALRAGARREGSLNGAVLANALQALLDVRGGRLAAGEASMGAAFAANEGGHLGMDLVSGALFALEAIEERGGFEALVAATAGLELEEEFAASTTGAHLAQVRGRLAVARGDRGAAVTALRTAVQVYGALRSSTTITLCRCTLALLLARDDPDEAADLVSADLADAERIGLARGVGIARRADGILTGGDAGIEQLGASAEILRESPARLEHARSLLALGAALRRSGRRADARAVLEQARAAASACGALRTFAGADEELRATGARPRRIAVSGPDALTGAERRVADLVSRGATNAEAAQELFVSLKTVETHLTRAYAKLGLSGAGARAGLAAALAADSEAENIRVGP
jgi:DNA-binding CsgD family transcriptional regulator